MEIAAIPHTRMKHMETKKAPRSAAFLPAQVSGRKYQAAARTLRFPALWVRYNHDHALRKQAPVDEELQKMIPVPLHARILYLWQYLILAGHLLEIYIYDPIRPRRFLLHIEKRRTHDSEALSLIWTGIISDGA